MLEFFLNELKEEVNMELGLYEPSKLTEAMFKARRIKEKNVAVGKGNGGQSGKSNNTGHNYGDTKFTPYRQPITNKASKANNSGSQSPVNNKNAGGQRESPIKG